VLRAARDADASFCIIIEDDAVFDLDKLQRYLPRLTYFLEHRVECDDWDLLFLGHLPLVMGRYIMQIDDFTVCRTRSSLTHCYIANLRSPNLITLLTKPIPVEDSSLPIVGSRMHIDYVMGRELENCMAIVPMIAFQRNSPSDNRQNAFMEMFRPNSETVIEAETITRLFQVPESMRRSDVLVYGMHGLQKALLYNPVARQITSWIPRLARNWGSLSAPRLRSIVRSVAGTTRNSTINRNDSTSLAKSELDK
jgi:hypothetical protein